MTTDRPYRKGMAVDTALKIFENEVDSGQWDPNVVKALMKIMKE